MALSSFSYSNDCFKVKDASYKPARTSIYDSYRVILESEQGEIYRLRDSKVVREIFNYYFDDNFSALRFGRMNQDIYNLNKLEEDEAIAVCLSSLEVLVHDRGSPTIRSAKVDSIILKKSERN